MRQVLAIHRHGSFVKAADELGVAQPTLSKSIARLEDELGLKLFDRSGSGAKVTPMGALIVGRAERIIVDAERLGRDVELLAAGRLGEVRIGFGPSMRELFLPRLTVALATHYPSLRLHMLVERRDSLVSGLLSGRLDMIIAAEAHDLDGHDLVHTELLRERMVAVGGPDHPLVGREKVSVEEFARYPNASPAASAILSTPALLGIESPNVEQSSAYVTNDYTTIKAVVGLGLATYVGLQHLVVGDLAEGNFGLIDLDLRSTVKTVAVMTRAAGHSPILAAIVGHARSIGVQLMKTNAEVLPVE